MLTRKIPAPRPAEQVQRHEEALEQLRDDRGDPHRGAVEADGERPLRRGKFHPDDGQDLRDKRSGSERLQDARCDEEGRCHGQPAQR